MLYQPRDILSSMFRMSEISCVVCGAEIETALHLFKDCPSFRAMAFACKWSGKVDNWNYAFVHDIVEIRLNPLSYVCCGEMDRDYFTFFSTCLLFGF